MIEPTEVPGSQNQIRRTVEAPTRRPKAGSYTLSSHSVSVLRQDGRVDEPIDEWDALPIVLTLDEAARLLRIGRSKAYELAAAYTSSGGVQGLPVLRLGDLLRVPKFALHEYVTTGHIAQLMPQLDANATRDAIVSRKLARTSPAADRAQLSLLGSD